MKQLLLVFLALLLFHPLVHSQRSTSYTIYLRDCDNKYDDSSSLYYNQINENMRIVDAATQQEIAHQTGDKPWKFQLLTTAKRVTIRFLNSYQQETDTTIELQTDQRIKNVLCVDHFVDYPLETSLEKTLNAGKEWKIQMMSFGCFHSYDWMFSIERQGQELVFSTYEGDNKQEVKRTNLNSLNVLIRFEKQLLLMDRPRGGCTTRVTYKVSSPFGNYQIIDASCIWSGFDNIYKSYFAKE